MDAAALSDSLLVLAQALGADDAQVDAARTGRLAACDVLWQALERHRDWLLVIDDADDVAELETAGRTVRDGNGWVRGSRSGLVVVSTRDGDPRHWGRGAELHPVGWLSKEQGGQVLVDLVPWARRHHRGRSTGRAAGRSRTRVASRRIAAGVPVRPAAILLRLPTGPGVQGNSRAGRHGRRRGRSRRGGPDMGTVAGSAGRRGCGAGARAAAGAGLVRARRSHPDQRFGSRDTRPGL
ncbi:hypothetical protein ACFSTC_16605 [Nonomuraea ferruginea]